MAYSLNGSERETIICFSEDEETATLYTASPVWMRKLDRISAEHSEFFREQENERAVADGRVVSKRYTFPKDLLTVRSGRRVYSEEQRAVMAERLRASRAQNQI